MAVLEEKTTTRVLPLADVIFDPFDDDDFDDAFDDEDEDDEDSVPAAPERGPDVCEEDSDVDAPDGDCECVRTMAKAAMAAMTTSAATTKPMMRAASVLPAFRAAAVAEGLFTPDGASGSVG